MKLETGVEISDTLMRIEKESSKYGQPDDDKEDGQNPRPLLMEKDTQKACTLETAQPTADSLTQDALSDDESLIANLTCRSRLLKVILLFRKHGAGTTIKINEPQK